MPYEQKLRNMGLFILGKGWLWRYLTAAPSTCKEDVKKMEPVAWWEGERQ